MSLPIVPAAEQSGGTIVKAIEQCRMCQMLHVDHTMRLPGSHLRQKCTPSQSRVGGVQKFLAMLLHALHHSVNSLCMSGPASILHSTRASRVGGNCCQLRWHGLGEEPCIGTC
jgi:hypothetical protein